MSPTRLEQDSPAYRPGEGRDHLETQEAVSPDSWLPSRLLQIGKVRSFDQEVGKCTLP